MSTRAIRVHEFHTGLKAMQRFKANGVVHTERSCAQHASMSFSPKTVSTLSSSLTSRARLMHVICVALGVRLVWSAAARRTLQQL